MRFRFREWGSVEWTFVTVDGEGDATVLAILGSGLARFHCQLYVEGRWENLGE